MSFNIVNSGQDVINTLYFINQDGTVGSANIETGIMDNNEIVIKKDIGFKNIVSIVSGVYTDGMSGADRPMFIDINGNIFD